MKVVLAVAVMAMLVSACGGSGPHGPPKQKSDPAARTAEADESQAADATASDEPVVSQYQEPPVGSPAGPHGPPPKY